MTFGRATLLVSLFPSALLAQPQWISYQGDVDTWWAYGSYAVELAAGDLGVLYTRNLFDPGPPIVLSDPQTRLARLDQNGVALGDGPFDWNDVNYRSSFPLPSSGATQHVSLGWPENDDALDTFSVLLLNDQLDIVDAIIHNPPENSSYNNDQGWTSFLDYYGNLIVVRNVDLGGTGAATHLDLSKYDGTTGQHIATALFPGTYYPAFGGYASVEGFEVMFPICLGLGPSGYANILRFDNELNYVSGLQIPGLNFQPLPNPQDSFPEVTGFLHMPDDGYVISALTYNVSGRECLMKISPTGELLRLQCAADSANEHHRVNGSVLLLADNTVLWSYNTGYQGIDSSCVVHLVRFDQALNELNHGTIRAYDSRNLTAYNMMATSTGRIVASGGANGSSPPDLWGWVAMYDPTVGFDEYWGESTAAQVYPNPGTTHLTVQLSEAVAQRTQLSLFDGLGRVVASSPMPTNTLIYDATDLAPGLYLYRITSVDGRELATGRWVKE